ncbi:MAG: type II secretion system protein N [Gammaproteobacteria bacterium]
MRLFIIGLVAYLLFLPAMTPAAHLINWLGLADAGLSVGSVGGTAWAGHARTLRYERLELDKVRWRFQPQGLLLARLEYRVKFFATDSNGTSRAGRSLRRDFYIRDLRAKLSAVDINPLMPPATVQLGGTFHLDLPTVAYKNGLVDVEGAVIWQDAIIVDPVSVSLGSLQLLLKSGENGITGTLTDIDEQGPLDLQGDLSLHPDHSYQLSGTLKPRAALPAQVRRVLPFLGLPDAEGRYRIEFSGVL